MMSETTIMIYVHESLRELILVDYMCAVWQELQCVQFSDYTPNDGQCVVCATPDYLYRSLTH